MTDTPPATNAGLSGQVLLYQEPEPLDAARHAKLGMRSMANPFAFVAKQHFVPLQVGEFGFAAISFPIIFAGDVKSPLAVMGLRDGENLFVDENGAFRAGVYVPSFIRRYPFVSAQDSVNGRMVVCIDRAAALWTEDNPDVMLFEDGKPTAFTNGCIEFCSQFDADRLRTESFVKLLEDLDLFENRQATFTPRNADGSAGAPVLVSEFFAVSEAKINALSHNKLSQLRDSGALKQIYAHLVSLQGWERIITESLLRSNAVQPVGNA